MSGQLSLLPSKRDLKSLARARLLWQSRGSTSVMTSIIYIYQQRLIVVLSRIAPRERGAREELRERRAEDGNTEKHSRLQAKGAAYALKEALQNFTVAE